MNEQKPDITTLDNLRWRLPKEDRLVLDIQVKRVERLINSHDALVDALRLAQEYIARTEIKGVPIRFQIIDQALKSVEEVL